MATILQVAGAMLVSAGVLLVYPPAGIVVAGIFAILFGIAKERGQ